MKKINKLKSMILLFTIFLMFNIHFENNISADSQTEDNTTLASSFILIESDQDFINLGLPGSGTELDPYLIENFQITSDSLNSGIKVTNTSKHFLIKNCYIRYGFNGISILDVASGTAKIEENICETSYKNGIWIESTTDAYVARNNFSCNVICGIRLENCNESIFEDNVCNDNGGDGILICNSYDLLINHNIMMNNIYYGIASKIGSGTTISNNYISNHVEFGVFLNVYSSDFIVHHNDFVGNLQGSAEPQPQACDHGENNIWYDTTTSEGNFWEDWNGKGTYQIFGNEGCCDPYPLSVPASGLAPEKPEETNFLLFSGLMALIGFLALAVYAKRT